MAPDLAKWLTVSQVAESLQVGTKKVVTWIATGKLFAIDISERGRSNYRICPASFQTLVMSMSVTPIPTRVRGRRKGLRRQSSIHAEPSLR